MKQSIRNLIIFCVLVGNSAIGYAQSVTPITTTEVIPTTAAAPVVTAATTTTTTTTTSTQTVMDAFYAQVAAEQQALATQAEAEAKAQTNAAQLAAGMQLAFQYCPFLQESNAKKARKGISDIGRKAAEQADDPRSQDPSLKNENKQEVAQDKQGANVGASCDIFFKENGEPGSVGTALLAGVRENKSSFAGKVPKDMKFLCPNYSTMDEEQRNLFWVWVMMSMSSTESGCDPNAVNENAVHGPAIGLFQLGKDQCPNADLKNGIENSSCALKKFASEMSGRSTLIATSARSSDGATNWAAVCKGSEKECGKNPGAVQKTIDMIKKYSACGASSDASSKRSPSGKKQKSPKKSKSKQPQLI
jgi:hypothetical protein